MTHTVLPSTTTAPPRRAFHPWMAVYEPLERAWHFRELIRAVVRRELAVRFRGSALGWLWAIFGPLVMLSFYTVIFSSALGVPRSSQAGGVKTYAVSMFIGLIVFNFFSELAYRAPAMLHEHSHFIKKSIFPSETLAWIACFRALTYAGISFAILLVFVVAVTHGLPATILMLPFIILPLMLLVLGISWFLMALGSFTRDVTHLMVSIVPLLMFATPIFYSLSDVPAHLRPIMELNIIGDYVDMARSATIRGQLPDPFIYLGTVFVSLVVFVFGYRFFMRYKSVFVDVI